MARRTAEKKEHPLSMRFPEADIAIIDCADGGRTCSPASFDPDGATAQPVPCLLLGQLATDRTWVGRGIGTDLLKHALGRCVTASRLIGGRALVVHV